MIVCPECHATTASDSPFCEQCGYRLRSQETSVEGIAAITPEQTMRSSRAPKRDATPARARRTREDYPSVSGARAPSSTLVEGMRAVQANQPTGEVPSVTASSSSIIQQGPDLAPARGRSLWLLLVMALLGGVGIGAIGAIALDSIEDKNLVERAAAMPALDEILLVPAATYKRGLSESTRSFLLRTCYRVAENADEACQQDALLRGEYPQVDRQIAAYRLDRNEATQSRYQACVDSGACAPIQIKECKVYTSMGYQVGVRVPKATRAPEAPVVCITRDQAAAFCASQGGRLPSADEWERAARGRDDDRLFPWGNVWSPRAANWGELDLVRTTVAGRVDDFVWSAPPGQFDEGHSPEGARDMAGNVAEWVAPEPSDGDQAVARGGSWASDPFALRVTGRLWLDPAARRADVGVRCAYDAP